MLGFVFGGFVGWIASSGTVFAQGGQLEVEPAVLDFGSCGHREQPELPLYLRNTGDEPLRILETKASCSCIQVVPARLEDPIPPGGERELRVTMSSGRAIGALSKYLTISTDGLRRSIRVPTRLSVFPGLQQDPREVVFEGVVGGKPSERLVDLSWSPRATPAQREAPLKIEFVDVVSSFRRAGLTGSIAQHFSYGLEDSTNGRRIRLSVLPSHPEGRIAATVKLKVDAKPFEISVRGEMFRGVVISPRQLNFSRVQTTDTSTFEKSILLRAVDGKAFDVERLEVETNAGTKIPGFRLAITPGVGPDGRQWRLRSRVVVPVGVVAQGSFSGKLRVHTTHPEQSMIEIGFFGFIRD